MCGRMFLIMYNFASGSEIARGAVMKAGVKKLSIAFAAFMLFFMLSSLYVHADGERATFNTGSSVRSVWTSLAGSRDKVKEIRQYDGASVPEGVDARIVSASDSETPIYSWFSNGVIYYWSEDKHPYTNKDSSYMFNGFTNATFIDAAPFDTSRTTDMEAMFANCRSVKRLDVSGFDTSNVRCMYCMFIYDSSLEELDVSHFNTTNCTQTSDENYGSLCGMFLGCSGVKMLDLSSFDMTRTSWTYHTQNMFPGCTSLEKLKLGPDDRFNSYTAFSGSWTHVEDGMTLSGSQLTSGYNAANSIAYSGTWIRNMPEGHYYRTDGSLGPVNMWEVHSPDDRFKGYCLNLNRFGVGEELDRILAEDDSEIIKLLCTEDQGSVHGYSPLGSSMREALITLIYYGWPNDAAGIQSRYGLTDQEYLEVTQNAVWDFTDRYDEPAGPTLYTGNMLAAYNELVAQRYANIEGKYTLFLYKSWDPSKQNLLSIMGVDDDVYGGVCIRKQNADGSENLAGAEFTIYDEQGNPVETIVTGPNGTAYCCRTDHSKGLPLGKYTVRETKAPAGYELSDWEYHFEITDPNVIVTEGWRQEGDDTKVEEMIYFDAKDETYEGGGVAIVKKSDTGKNLVGAEFTIYDSEGKEVKKLITNDAGVAATGKQDLPLGTYTVTETKAPAGHRLADPASQTVTISKNLQVLTVSFTDDAKKGSVTLQAHKTLESATGELKGGEFAFQLLDAHGNMLQEKRNDADGNVVFDTITYTPDDLGFKNYHIIEVIENGEYTYDRHEEDVTVTIYDDGSDILLCTPIYDSDGAEFVNSDAGEKFKLKFAKKKLNTDTQLEGAKMELKDQAGRMVDSWVSTGEPYEIELDPGQYVLREITAPAGYYRRSDIKFTVTKDGKIECSDTAAYDESAGMINIYDTVISSTGLSFRKVDSETGSPLEEAEFTMKGADEGTADYSRTVTTGIDGIISFDNLETGKYTLEETKVPYGYSTDRSPWNVEVGYNRIISRTDNVDADGTADGDYPSGEKTDTITIPGSPEKMHVKLRYQTEDGYDYLLLKDAEGNTITQDADGNPIGDTRDQYKGRLWGGMESGEINELSFDLPGDTVTFYFYADENTAAYGYHAEITTDTTVTVTDSKGEKVELDEEGLYDLPNDKVEKTAAKAEIRASKILKGRGWQQGDSFTFELAADSGDFPVPEKKEVTVSDDKEVSFGEITFDKEGIYTYTIREKQGTIEGMTYDNTAHKVSVKVEDKDKDLVLEAAVTYENSESETSATITNTYEEKTKPEEDKDKKTDTDNGKDVDDAKDDVSEAVDESDDVTTGDESGIMSWLLISAVSVAALGVVIAARRRKSR